MEDKRVPQNFGFILLLAMKNGVKHDGHQVTDKVGLWLAHF